MQRKVYLKDLHLGLPEFDKSKRVLVVLKHLYFLTCHVITMLFWDEIFFLTQV